MTVPPNYGTAGYRTFWSYYERSTTTHEHLPAHRRLWVPVQLRAELPGRARWVGRVAMPAASRLPERVRHAPRPGRRFLQVRSRQYSRSSASQICPGHDGAGDDLADADRMDDRSRPAGHRSGPARFAAAGLPPGALRLRRRRRPRPDSDVYQRPGRSRRELQSRCSITGPKAGSGTTRATVTTP
jgi:hypothetical protein